MVLIAWCRSKTVCCKEFRSIAITTSTDSSPELFNLLWNSVLSWYIWKPVVSYKRFFKILKQRVVLNGQNSYWKGIKSGVPQGSILGSLLFFSYINNLPDSLSSNCKLFTDDTPLFSVVHYVTISPSDLNIDLAKIGEWEFKWKISQILTHLSQLKK